jgi:hypothetical protein
MNINENNHNHPNGYDETTSEFDYKLKSKINNAKEKLKKHEESRKINNLKTYIYNHK